MNISEEKIITLNDGNEYVVVSKVDFEGSDYVYIVDINNSSNFKFARIGEENSQIFVSELEDTDLINILIPLFYDSSKKYLDNLEQ